MIKPKVEIIIVTYNNQDDIDRCLRSIHKLNYPNFSVTIVDNASSDLTLIKAKEVNSNTFFIKNSSNTGFAKANNQGMHHAFSNNANFCWLLNPDTEVTPNSLSALIDSHSKNKNIKVGLIQPIILQLQNKELINTVGNALHYLGFGFCKDNGKKFNPQDFKQDKSIISVSGAAMLVSKSYYQEVGEFNELFFMYNEDQDYSWRGITQGYDHLLSASSIVHHDYNYTGSRSKWFHSEKNRLFMLMSIYELKTLLLLAPAIVFTELISGLYSILNRMLTYKIRGYIFLLRNYKSVMTNRNHIKKRRRLSDKYMLHLYESNIQFSEVGYTSITSFLSLIYYYYFIFLKFFYKD